MLELCICLYTHIYMHTRTHSLLLHTGYITEYATVYPDNLLLQKKSMNIFPCHLYS